MEKQAMARQQKAVKKYSTGYQWNDHTKSYPPYTPYTSYTPHKPNPTENNGIPLFQPPQNNKTGKIGFMSGWEPKITFTWEAYVAQCIITEICKEEAGWLMPVYEDKEGKRKFKITEVFLPKQEVSSTLNTLTTEGLSDLGVDIVNNRKDGMEVFNRIDSYGHSHHDMGTFASSLDTTIGALWNEKKYWIRIITAKGRNLDLRCWLFEYSTGIIVDDVQWEVEGGLHQEVTNEMLEFWKNEIEKKVTTRSYVYTPTHTPYNYNNHWDKWGQVDYEMAYGIDCGIRDIVPPNVTTTEIPKTKKTLPVVTPQPKKNSQKAKVKKEKTTKKKTAPQAFPAPHLPLGWVFKD